jgi:hypothetical protein
LIVSFPWVEVNDRMQHGYRYALTVPIGRDFHPDFKPDLTPAEMLALGVFGGKYMTDCGDEFLDEWFAQARLSCRRDSQLNFFGVDASQPLSVWRAKGWIHPRRSARLVPMVLSLLHGPADVGRGRTSDQAVESHGKLRRSAAAQLRTARLHCRRRQRQALLQWAYDSRTL